METPLNSNFLAILTFSLLVFTKDERRPICLACWKSLEFVKFFEMLGKQMHLGYCRGKYIYSVKFSSIYLLSSNLYEFWKKGQFFSAYRRLYLRLQIRYLPKHVNNSERISLQPIYQKTFQITSIFEHPFQFL